MEDRQSLEQQVEGTFQRLRALLERSGATPEAKEALAALRASCDELKADAQEEAAGHRAAQAALAAERSLASTLLDTVGALVVVLDREGCIVRFNRMCEQTTGYTFETVKGQRFWDLLLLPEEVGPVRAAFDDLRSGHFPNNFENIWVARDGSRRLIAWTNTAIPGLDGSPEYIIGTGLDITERRQAEERARFLSDILEHASQPFAVGYPGGRLGIFNAAYRDLLGYGPEELAALDWSADLTPPEWRALEAERLAELQRSGEPVRYEKEHIRKDGTRVPVELLVHLVCDEAGAPQYYYSFITDITERNQARLHRKAALAALRESEERYRTLFDAMTEGFALHEIICDEQGQPVDYRFLEINPSFERLTGLKRADVVGQLKSAVLPNDDPHWLQIYSAVALTGQPVHFENYSTALDRYYEVYAYCPAPRQFAVLFIEITERVQAAAERERLLEENRRQRQFLERLLEVAPVGVAVVRGPDYRYEYANATYQAASGAPMVGRTVAEVFPAAVAHGSLAGVEAVYRTGQAASLRGYEANLGPGREQTYWDLDRVPLKAPDGSVEGVLIVAREVTEEVLARRQAVELAARDEAILNSLAEGIVVFDADSNVLTMNPAALRMQGSDSAGAGQARLADLAGRFRLRHPDGRSLAPEEWPITRALRGETFNDCQAQVEHLDTGRTWIASYGGAPVRDAAGRVTMGVLTLRDITTQKQAESQREAARLERERLLAELNAANEGLQAVNEELQVQAEELHFQTLSLEAERARLRAIIDSAPEAILVADERGEVAMANPAAERLLGASTQGAGWPETMGEVIRRQPDHAAYRPHELPLFRAAVHREVQRDVALAVAWPDGQWRDVLTSAVPILDSRGHLYGAVAIYQDITERLQAEETLRVALEKYRVLFESFPLGITISDEAGQILECNKEAERLLGIPQAEHTQRDIGGPEWRLIRPDGSPMPAEDYASIRALREKRLIENVEMGIVKEGGDVTWLNVTAAPIPLEGYGVAVTYGDISEQVRAKQERDRLLEQARRDRESIAGLAAILQREWDTLQTIMESTPAQLAYLDPDFNFIRVNSAYARGSGHGQEELIGANHFDLFPNAENQAIFERVRASGRPTAFSAKPFEFANQPERGVTYWDWTLVPVKGSDGQVLGLVLSLLDVTDQVASRRAVEELAARDEAILNSLSEGIITIDREGNFLTINPAAPRILGFGETEQAEERFKDAPNAFEMHDLNGVVVPAESSPQARLMRGETFGSYELHVRNLATGATWIGSFSGAPVRDADGNLAMGVLAVHDITVEKQAEAQRDASLEELKARLAEKEVLMREIYHRVKNNVQALIYLMDMQTEHITDENTLQMIHELQERARAMALVHEKLYQSQNLAQIDFGDYLYDLVDNLSHAFGADRPIVWRIDVENVSLSVDAAIPCGLVVSELLTNTLKYAFPGGRPVAARGETECAVSITSRVEGNRITLVVADNGVGLPAEIDWATTNTLGLQLINILARHQLGGQIEVDRSAGTSFTITFTERMKK